MPVSRTGTRFSKQYSATLSAQRDDPHDPIQQRLVRADRHIKLPALYNRCCARSKTSRTNGTYLQQQVLRTTTEHASKPVANFVVLYRGAIAMDSVAPKKRSSPESIDVLAMGLSGEKKPRVEGSPEFTQLVAEGGLEVGSVYRMDLGFGEWGGELIGGLGGGDVLSSTFESFCSGSTLDIVPVTEGSDVSSDDDRPAAKLESAEPSAQSGRRMIEKEGEDETATVKNEGDINLKRQADRAARNRESSRRAREKAKNRFRTLENENTVQREMIRRFRIQNENLMARLERASAMQQSCTMCRYNAAMVQQPSFGAQSGQGPRR